MYQRQCLKRCLLILCDYCGNPVANMTHLAVKESSVIRTGLGVSLTGLHVIYIRTVLMSDDSFHSFKRLCFLRVDFPYISHGVWGAEDLEDICSRFNLVFHKHLVTRDKSIAVDLVHRLSDVTEVIAESGTYSTLVHAGFSLLLHKADSKIEMLIARIPYEEGGKSLLHIISCRIGLVLKQMSEDEGRCRGIVCTLDDTGFYHGLLHVIQRLSLLQRFGSPDISSFKLETEHEI